MSEQLCFLGDMNLSPLTIAALQKVGWDIIRVSEVLHATTSDLEILEYARQNGRIIVTQDLDFSALLALGGHSRPSLITLRLSNTDPTIVTERLTQIVNQVEGALRNGSAVTVNDKMIRIRALPIA